MGYIKFYNSAICINLNFKNTCRKVAKNIGKDQKGRRTRYLNSFKKVLGSLQNMSVVFTLVSSDLTQVNLLLNYGISEEKRVVSF